MIRGGQRASLRQLEYRRIIPELLRTALHSPEQLISEVLDFQEKIQLRPERCGVGEGNELLRRGPGFSEAAGGSQKPRGPPKP